MPQIFFGKCIYKLIALLESANINRENILLSDLRECPSIRSQINEMPQHIYRLVLICTLLRWSI